VIKINLVAKRVHKDRLLVQKQAMYTVGLLVLALAVGLVMGSLASNKRDRYMEELAMEKSEQSKLLSAKKKNAEFKIKKKRREEILQVIDILQERKKGPRPFLDYLNMILPADIWLTMIAEKDLNITVTGYTFSPQAVAELMRSMEASDIFSTVELYEIQKKILNGEEVKSFTINAHWDLREIVPVDGKKG
jgi:Tfp pilus assembly protein PilN